MHVSKFLPTGVISILATLATLALATAPALANSAHASTPRLIGSGPGSGAGELSLVAGNANEAGSGVAVDDETHDVYVADTGNNRVDEFEADGTFLRAWGWGVVNGKAELQVCEATCRTGLSGSAPGELEAPSFVAVDNDLLSPSHGDLYVGDPGHLETIAEGSPDNLVTKFRPEGELEESWGVKGQLDGTSGLGLFGQPAGVAVDTFGNLWVYVKGTLNALGNHMYEFEAGGAFKQAFEAAYGGYSPQGIAVDGSGDLYISDNATSVAKLSSSGSGLGGVFGGTVTGLAAEPATDALYVDQGGSIARAGTSEEFGAPNLQGGAGLAVDSSEKSATSGTVYAANTVSDQVDAFAVALEVNPKPGSASEVEANTATLSGEVNPVGSPVSECYFEYATSSVFATEHVYDHTAPCEPDAAGLGEGTKLLPVEAKLPGLLGGTTYHFRLVGKKGVTTVAGNDEVFTTATVPIVTGGEAKNLTLHPAAPPEEPEATVSAELRASVNPEGLQVTRCVFEYGTTTAYGASARCAQKKSAIGYGTEPVLVSAQLVGLAPDTKYYWRLSVDNINGEGYEPGHTFVYGTEGSALPDGRAYEMVTPPFKDGAALDLDPAGAAVGASVAEDGSRVFLPSIQCPPGARSCTVSDTRNTAGGVFEFSRTPAGWVSTPLSPPATEFPSNQPWVANVNTDTVLYSMETPSSGREEQFFVRGPEAAFTAVGPAAFPGSAESLRTSSENSGHEFQTSSDFSHVVWRAEYRNLGAFWPFDQTTANGSVYEYPRAGDSEPPLLVGVSGGEDSHELIGTCGTVLGTVHSSARGAVSADGRTVVFTANPEGRTPECFGSGAVNEQIPVPVGELYARVDGEEPDAHTVAISQPDTLETAGKSPPDENCTGPCKKNIEAYVPPAVNPSWRDADFVYASEDGSKVVFMDTQQLTNGASEGPGSAQTDCEEGGIDDCNLYLYDFAQPAGHNLIDISEGVGGVPVPGGPRVQEVEAVSSDGSHVYFVAKGKLASNKSALGVEAVAGEGNLYVYERDARYPLGHTAFIASLPSTDYNGGAAVYRGPNVTPEGRFLVFASGGELTPDDTREGGPEQIFRYDAATEQLIRVSIGDEGFNDNGNAGLLGGEGTDGVSSGAALIEGPKGSDRRGDPTMSNDGSRVFFTSPVGLTPKALNDVPIGTYTISQGGPELPKYALNVYEWEQGGVGSCPAGHAAGCVYLISDGRDTAEAGGAQSAVKLIGSDASGDNVFFTTADQLAPADTDTEVDVYDARVCEPEGCVAEATPPLPPCLGEQCHGIPAATPSLLAPGTASFNGEGNIAPAAVKPAVKKKAVKCRKGYVKKKTKCVKNKKAKKAGNDRRDK